MDIQKTQKFRLDRLLSQTQGLTRRQAQVVIRNAEVHFNGAAVTDPGMHVGAIDRVQWRGRDITLPSSRYFMLNKPKGVVCATRDREHRTVLDLLKIQDKTGLHVAGRLDLDATGLVLITDDGEWSHRMTSPRFKCPKSYLAELAEPLDTASVSVLEMGVHLHGESKRCAPAKIELTGERTVRITVTEGKYHQVKRMFAAVGNRVASLHREQMGGIVLDPGLPAGAFRPLTPGEIDSTKNLKSIPD